MTNTAASFDQIKVAEQRRQYTNTLQEQPQYCMEISPQQSSPPAELHTISSDEEGSYSSDANSTNIFVNEPPAGSIAGRFVCKARGLGNSHNDQTAFIEVPEGAKHGQVLHCTHAECVNSGRRFRYCFVCRVPVAKRNFSMRHSHGVPMTFYRGKPCWTVPVSQKELVSDNNTKRKRVRELASPSIQEVQPQKRTKRDENEEKWMSLFENRPATTDTNAMDQWMKSVIEVSELFSTAGSKAETFYPRAAPPQNSEVAESSFRLEPLPVPLPSTSSSLVMGENLFEQPQAPKDELNASELAFLLV